MNKFDKFKNALVLYGGYKLSLFGHNLYKTYINEYQREPVDLIKQYGDGYVVITNVSDSLGQSYARNFAKKNKNLIIMGSNLDQLKNIKNELSEKYQIDVRTLQFDFNNTDTQIFDKVGKTLSFFDISIVLNNIRSQSSDRIHQIEQEKICEIIQKNCIGSMLFTRSILPHLNKQKHKSTFIDIGSQEVELGTQRASVYQGTQKYRNCLSSNLFFEFDGRNIDFQTILPGLLQSPELQKLYPDVEKRFLGGLLTENSEYFVQKSIEKIGTQNVNTGSERPSFFYAVFTHIPSLMQYMIKL